MGDVSVIPVLSRSQHYPPPPHSWIQRVSNCPPKGVVTRPTATKENLRGLCCIIPGVQNSQRKKTSRELSIDLRDQQSDLRTQFYLQTGSCGESPTQAKHTNALWYRNFTRHRSYGSSLFRRSISMVRSSWLGAAEIQIVCCSVGEGATGL